MDGKHAHENMFNILIAGKVQIKINNIPTLCIRKSRGKKPFLKVDNTKCQSMKWWLQDYAFAKTQQTVQQKEQTLL